MKNEEYCPNCFSPIEYTMSEKEMKHELARKLYPQAEEFKYLEDRCDLCNRPLPVDPIPHTPGSCPACHQPTTVLETSPSIFAGIASKY